MSNKGHLKSNIYTIISMFSCIIINICLFQLVFGQYPSRNEITKLYVDEFIMSNIYIDPEWTGDIDKCIPGTTSQEFRDVELSRINFYRKIVGLDSIIENTEFHEMAQATSLIISANKFLDHFYTEDYKCFTELGNQGAQISNILLGAYGANAINGYINSYGHRINVLTPNLLRIGMGDVGPYIKSNTLVVFYNNGPVEHSRGLVAYPPSGYFPYKLGFKTFRWTLQNFKEFDLSNTNITMYLNGVTINHTIIEKSKHVLAFSVDYNFEKNIEDVKLLGVIDGIKHPNDFPLGNGKYIYDVIVYDPLPNRINCQNITITKGNDDINGLYFPVVDNPHIYIKFNSNIKIQYVNDKEWIIGNRLAVNPHINFDRDWFIKDNDKLVSKDIGFVCVSNTKLINICKRIKIEGFIKKRQWLNKKYNYGGAQNGKPYYTIINTKSVVYLYWDLNKWVIGKELGSNNNIVYSTDEKLNDKIVPYSRGTWGTHVNVTIRCKTRKRIQFAYN